MTKDQEEFDKLVKKLYALADKMGNRLEIRIRRKTDYVPPRTKPGLREPGDE